MADAAIHLTERNFDETLAQHSEVMMVDFWAEWCGPCRAIAPALEDLAKESAGWGPPGQGDVGENPGPAAPHRLPSLPPRPFVTEGEVGRLGLGALPQPQ